VVQTFKDKRQISQRLRFQISSKKKHSLTGWTQLINKKRNLLKIKRLGHWYRCSRLWMTKAFYKNACNIILRFKLLMTKSIMKNNKLSPNLKSWKTNPSARIKKKEDIL
jgi:hypothetical protein